MHRASKALSVPQSFTGQGYPVIGGVNSVLFAPPVDELAVTTSKPAFSPVKYSDGLIKGVVMLRPEFL